MQFRYPTYTQNTPPALSDAESIRNTLLREVSGHYLLGQKGNWHGGIHLTQLTHPNHSFEPVRALANGCLIAWRFTDDYSRVDFANQQLEFASRTLRHSTCFCLLRHQYQLPDSQNTFTFYSLYMHLRPLKHLPGLLYRLKSDRNTRNAANPANHSEAPKLLSSGTLIECLPDAVEQHPLGGSEYLFIKAREYKPTSDQPESSFWIALQQVNDQGYFERFFERINPLPWQACRSSETTAQSSSSQPGQWRTIGRRNIRRAPPPYDTNSPAVTLDNNTLVEALSVAPVEGKVDEKTYSFREVKVLEGIHRNKTGWMAFEDSGFTTVETTPVADVDTRDEAEALPQAPSDTAQRLVQPMEISAGDPLGYLGQHDVLKDLLGNTQERYQVHLEVFSTEQPPASLFSEEQDWHFLTNENSPLNQLPERNSVFLQQLLEHLGETQAECSTPEQITRIHNQALQSGQLEKLIVQHPSEWHHEQDRQTREWIAKIQGRVYAGVRGANGCEEREEREDGYERSKANLGLELKRRQSLVFFGDVGLPSRVWYLHPLAMAAKLQSLTEDDDSTDWLMVPEGQFTFDVEGDDNPDSGFFSRVAHAPPGASGITLGRGFDLYQQRHKAKNILQKVGVDSGLIEFLLPAIGLQDDSARIYHKNNKGELNNFVITRRQQYDLYLETYPFYRIDTARLYDKHVQSEPNVAIPMFESLDYRIRDILIDMRYRGDFRQLSWDRASWWDRELAIDFRMAIRSNNPIVLARHFENYKYEEGSSRASWNDRNKYWKVPQDRYQRRIDYLRSN